jgi:hypothetical protein
VSTIGPIASSTACSKIFNAIADGHAQCDISKKLNENDKAILCKVAFQHCPGWFPVWDEMLDHPQCKVIYVRRENPIEIAISAANALRQGQWQALVKDDQQVRVGTVTLEPRHLMEYCAFYDSQTAFFDGYFSNYDNVMTVDFVDLHEKWDEISKQICTFIGVEEQEVELATKSMIGDGNHVSLIENLNEVYTYFRGSKWEKYFGIGQ